ncbi:MAG: tandem-95 repeat protein [Hormoscilla sp. GM102CHS1]|nr:tandem-95 repeat protein [Hormoscilla sp. GM102CHS1]
MALTGTASFEFLQGTPDPDIIRGLEGNDTLGGMEGDDNIQGNQGNDQLVGDEGNDILFGGMDNDILYGNQDEDSISGDQGSDSLFGGRGNDSLLGQQDDDSLWGNLGSDILYGGRGNDWLFGGQENDGLFGDLGNDILFGGKGNDRLDGGEGNDSLFGDLGADTVTGGDGSDIFVVAVIGDGTSGGDEVTDADIFADLMLDEDSIGLDGGLTFEDLEFEEVTEGIAIVHSETGSYLAVVQKVTLDQLDNAANFVIAPTLPTGQQQKPTILDPVLPETPDRPELPIGPIEPPNRPPIAEADTATATAGTQETIAVLENDSDPDGQEISIIGYPEATDHGTITLNPTNDALIYTAAAGFTGTDSFRYQIEDGRGGIDIATVTVTVEEENVAPVAMNDEATTTEGLAATISVLDNDFDIDGDPLSIAGAPATTELGATIDIDDNGTPEDASDDVLVYEPAELSETTTDSFTYTLSDGELTDTATVTVTVEQNRPPIAEADTATATEGTPETIAVLENDSDPDNGPETLSITGVSEAAEGGTISIDGETVVYTPPAVDAEETLTDSFTYTISDQNLMDTATVTVIVEPDNDPPSAVEDSIIATEGTATAIRILDNDTDPNNDEISLTDSPTSTTEGGNITLDRNGTFLDLTDDSLIYTSASGFTGTDNFTYTISDGELTDTATVTVTVEPVPNEAPIAQDDAATTTEGIAVTVPVLDNDSDPDNDTLEITAVTDPANGTIIIDSNGTPDNTTDDRILYTPDAGFNGTDDFTYSITAMRGGTDTATVTVTVEPDNQPPIASDDATTIIAETADNTIAVLIDDTDPDGDTLSITGITDIANGTVSIDGDRVIYTPDPSFVTVGDPDTFTYTITDGRGGTDTATVTVTVTANLPPVATNDQVIVNQDLQTLIIPVLLNDSDPDAGDTITVSDISTPDNGGTVRLVNNDQQVQYTPSSTVTGDLAFTDSFMYTITDSQGETDAATVTITFEPELSDDDALNGTDSDDLLVASDRDRLESQKINGGAGDDIIISGNGPKILDGGEGADTFVYESLETTTIAGDWIINFDPTMDKIVLDFEVSPGMQVTQDDVAIGTFSFPGFFTIGLKTTESFVISLRVRSDLDAATTQNDILDRIEFGTV